MRATTITPMPATHAGRPCAGQEEASKRAGRASRFNIERGEDPLAYAPDPREEDKRRRAEKFDIEYKPPDKVVMDMGESC